jgi:hypothetical protein
MRRRNQTAEGCLLDLWHYREDVEKMGQSIRGGRDRGTRTKEARPKVLSELHSEEAEQRIVRLK